jgi:hypothetical protein
MTRIDFATVARRIVLAMAFGVALLSVAVFVVLLVVQRDTLLEAAVQAAPLAAVAMLAVYATTMARCFEPR